MAARATNPKRNARQYGLKDSPELRARIVELLQAGSTIREACLATNLGRSTIDDWRKHDLDFHKECLDAIEDGTDMVEAEARRRAVEGYLKPVFQGGEQVGEVREYSDTLTVLLLKGRRKAVFSERTELTGADGGPVQHEMEVTFVKAKGAGK